jgi:hypothetical protein
MNALLTLLLTATAAFAQVEDKSMLVIPWHLMPRETPKEVPVFHSAEADVMLQVGLETVTSEQKVRFRVHQGKAATFSLALVGAGEVTGVTGGGLRDWSVRVAEGGVRFLDVRPVNPVEKEVFEVVVSTRGKVEKEQADVLLVGPAEATGFSLAIELTAAAGADVRPVRVEGLVGVEGSGNRKFAGASKATLGLHVLPSGTDPRGTATLANAELRGTVAGDGGSVAFRLTGVVRPERLGAVCELLSGGAALSGSASGDGWHIALRRKDNIWTHELVAERAGEFPVDLAFEAPVRRKGDWRSIDFRLPAGVVVPVVIAGPVAGTSFDPSLPVVPVFSSGQWRGFLPANGAAAMAWRTVKEMASRELVYTSAETTDIRVGSGLLRQQTVLDLRILQGALAAPVIDLTGQGEILSVAGDSVAGWTVTEKNGKRIIELRLSRPIEGAGRVLIEAQTALGGFPVRAEGLRMTPSGALRHNGWLRVANNGAVRIEVAEADGLIQFSPAQFPGKPDESLRQVFVYRFPSAEYRYVVNASQVMPEVGLTETTVYELAETDRRISTDIELDIREAPLREWEMDIPADHAVASVTGAEVGDYAVAADSKDGMRRLKILFRQAVSGRQLVSVRLEKNEAAKAGGWTLPPLGFPDVKSRRGYIGAVAAAGYRLAAANTEGLAEVPLTFFPKKTPGLQQAFRLREDKWSLGLTAEALGQSIQADVFHLYSLKSGAAYGSVLMNFFVIGSPATEWRVAVPKGVGNIDVTGQNVGRDWRREGDTVIVPLSRPLLGAGTLLLTFEQPMNASGGALSPGEVYPLDVQGERGFVQVVSPLQVNHKSETEGALLPIDPSEIPAEFRVLSTAPTLGAWQYTARDFRIGMDVEWFEPGETVGQVVDFQQLRSRVSRDGQWVTDARIFVKTRGRSALRMVIPEGAVLWEAKVGGAAVNARADGGETLVPLPAQADPNQAVEISLRYGARSGSPRKVQLYAPKLDAPVVIGEWTVTGDEGRQLVPRGGTADLVRPVLAENGWEWLERERRAAVALLVAGLAAAAFGFGKPQGLRRLLALVAGIGLMVTAAAWAKHAAGSSREALSVLEYAAPVVAANESISVVIGNVDPSSVSVNWLTWLILLGGIVAALAGLLRSERRWLASGAVLVAAALLSIRGGAPLFFGIVSVTAFLLMLPHAIAMIRSLRKPKPEVAAAALLALACLLPVPAKAKEADAPLKPAESVVHDWRIRDGRLFGTVDITVRGEAGEKFLFLRDPAVLSRFEGEGLKVTKAALDGTDAYWLVKENAGRASGRAEFEMPLADPAQGWNLPGGPAAMRRVTLRWDQGGWEFFCMAAAKTQALPDLTKDESGASIVLGPVDVVRIQARPKQRDAETEETKFFAEVANLFLPGPGVVHGRHRVAIRPAQGRVSTLTLRVPAGFTVSEVVDGPVGAWRFDPSKNELIMNVEPAQSQGFSFLVETQRGAGALPVELELEPLRVNGAAGEVGLLGMAFGEEAQPEAVTTDGLSRVNPGDFDAALLPRNREGQPLALLHHAFRYSAAVAKAKLKVTAVAPELRAETWQLVSLGEDRLVVSTDLSVMITRAGVFRLETEVPEGLEIESATGAGLSHWTEGMQDGRRILTFHLTGKTVGRADFSITLTGRPVVSAKGWQVPRVRLRGASRETGVLTVVPERGLQLLVTERGNISQLDPRELAGGKTDTARAAARPGAMAYRLLQSDWKLGLTISRLDPWVTARVFHDATIREGQLLTRVNIGYRIENSAVKSLRVRIPGLDEAAAATVRATGPAVADLVPVAGETGLWEIRFQRGIAGETDVELEYQRPSAETGSESVAPVALAEVRQLSYFVAVRAGGRLELEPGPLPRGWQRSDWAVMKSTLGRAAGGTAPALSFRAADVEGPLPVIIKRHELAGLRKLRVTEGTLTTLLSPGGTALTAVNLKMRVLTKSTLRLRLPADAGLFNTFVNDEGVNLVREGGDWLFHVFPHPDGASPSVVRFVYATSLRDGKHLEGPMPDVPMENLNWRVLVPVGWKVAGYGGDFDLQQKQRLGEFRLEDYQSFVSSKRRSDAQSAAALLDQANAWLAAGDQEKAGIALGNAVNNGQLDAASGEDARVQLRQLRNQQALLGLNTRRQKLVLDNRSAAPQADNSQLERAAEANPLLQGKYNYDPTQFDRFLEGNTADENAALKEIAARIVAQQLAAEPAPAALDVTLPERGTVLAFSRSMQVDGDRPMVIDLKLQPVGTGFSWPGILACLVLGVMAILRPARTRDIR